MPHHDIKTNPPATPPRRVATVPSHTDTTHTQRKTPYTTTPAEPPRALVLTLQILAYAIPLGFLAYVLYINYLPFGYDKTFTIDVGAEGDTTVGEFYLEPSPDLSERKVAQDGTTYRELNGMANVIFKPNVVLKDAEITVSVEGEGVSIIPPVIDFNPDDYEWDYEWDFTNPETAFTPKTSERARAEWTSCTTTASTTGASTEMGTGTISEDTEEFVTVPISADNVPVPISATTTEICEPIPVPDLVGNAFFFEDAMYFEGNSRLEMPSTADMFEEGPFTVYVEWTPNSKKRNQQIIGHFNWEVWQNTDSVEIRFGRIDNAEGTIHSIRYPVDDLFFYNKQSLLFVYNPGLNGHVKFYVNNDFAGSFYLRSSVIWNKYGSENLSLGWSPHNFGKSPFFEGKIFTLRLAKDDQTPISETMNVTLDNDSADFGIISTNESPFSKLKQILLYAKQRE